MQCYSDWSIRGNWQVLIFPTRHSFRKKESDESACEADVVDSSNLGSATPARSVFKDSPAYFDFVDDAERSPKRFPKAAWLTNGFFVQ